MIKYVTVRYFFVVLLWPIKLFIFIYCFRLTTACQLHVLAM